MNATSSSNLARGEFVVKSSSWDENRVFLEDDSEVAVQERPPGDDHLPAAPPPEPAPIEHYFP
jgi:hypothetical protein